MSDGDSTPTGRGIIKSHMVRRAGLFCLFALLLLCSCGRRQAVAEAPLVQEEQAFSGLSTLHVADPRAAAQLLKGFHPVEQGSWRWTQKQFAVALKVPTPGKPATLQLKFALPEPLLARLRSITLSASVNGVALPAETYTAPGDHVYSHPVPAAALAGDAARADFTLDKVLPPSTLDSRELGIVVTSVGLE